jgi:hypothetical protein
VPFRWRLRYQAKTKFNKKTQKTKHDFAVDEPGDPLPHSPEKEIAGVYERKEIGKDGWKGKARDADDTTTYRDPTSLVNTKGGMGIRIAKKHSAQGAQNPNERRRPFIQSLTI